MLFKKHILWFKDISKKDTKYVGGKTANIGEMFNQLSKKGIPIPNGFAITAQAYKYFIKETKIEAKIKTLLKQLKVKDIKNLQTTGKALRQLIEKARMPLKLRTSILDAYRKMNCSVAVRSSATAEDLPGASFAGQQETYLNVNGERHLITSVKKCFASLFTDRAISYREDKGFKHSKVFISVAVQKMVKSTSSGVIFTLDTESGFRDVVFINSSYGLGEYIVKGEVNPDEFYVHKPTLKKGYKSIITKRLGEKKKKLIYSTYGTRNSVVSKAKQQAFSLGDDAILKLAKYACTIEDHYNMPMDIEWALDKEEEKLYILQARPETVHAIKVGTKYEKYILGKEGEVIVEGLAVGEKIGRGTANLIASPKDIEEFEEGDVLVTDMTDPDWEPIMKIASAIVTEKGGRTCFTGDTKVLTNLGFMSVAGVYRLIEERHELFVPSLNRETLKIEWRKILASMKRKSEVFEIEVSQTGRMKGNTLRLTPDHKMLTYGRRMLVSEEIKDILSADDKLLIAQNLPAFTSSTQDDCKLAYLLGAIMTDGHVYLTNRHGEVQFIQKPTIEKQEFIATVSECMQSVFNKKFSVCEKKQSSGSIRGQPCIGSANAYRCYSKQIATQIAMQRQNIVDTMLVADDELILNFLAGVIDGDGTYGAGQNKINIYCSNELLCQGIVTGCLRLGIVPQISTNRTIYNIQIVEQVDRLLSFTNRVKGSYARKKFGTRFFAAKSLLGDVIDDVNYKGSVRPYVDNNLLIDAEKIRKNILPMCDIKTREELLKIINSDTRMLRAKFLRDIGEQDVYNLTVESNHNYLVFTDRYTPIIVNNCHAAIISRELGIPCVVGAEGATKKIKQGGSITVSCTEKVGKVYKGNLPFTVRSINIKKVPKTKTEVMMNVSLPDRAFKLAQLPSDGVGLAREEFIIAEQIGIHPLALVHFEELKKKKKDPITKKELDKIDKITNRYAAANKSDYFVDKLSEGISMIAAGFYPRPVIVRFSDFKSNEYKNLLGGKLFEPEEENPMIGWRGASRYYSDYRPAFELECKVIKKVREECGLKNIKVMIPFCRTIVEAKKVLDVMAHSGLKRGDLEIYMMVEIPADVLLLEDFCKLFDGFSIGSNDLTQLTLGLDRDSALVAGSFDERNPAVLDLIASAIKTARRCGKKIGLCGEAASTFPEFTKFLVRNKIDSISISPDVFLKTKLLIAKLE